MQAYNTCLIMIIANNLPLAPDVTMPCKSLPYTFQNHLSIFLMHSIDTKQYNKIQIVEHHLKKSF